MRLLRHKRGNPDTGLCRSLNHRATSRLYCLAGTATPTPSIPPTPTMPGIDLRQVRAQITIEQVLDLLEFVPTARSGFRLRGPGPIPGSRFPCGRGVSAGVPHTP